MDKFSDTCEYTIILLLVLTIIWMINIKRITVNQKESTLEWINQGHPSGKYGTFNPADRLKDTIALFGKPDTIDKSKGGTAIWKKSSLEKKGFCWDRVELRDEQVPHNNPGPHVDFMYYWYKLDVPEELICDVIKLSESVTYDPLKKMLSARCHFSGAIISTIVLAKRIANKEMTLEDAKKSYGPFIFSTIKSHKMYNSESIDSMTTELCEFKTQQKWDF
jgi:hypothetical protein